MTKAADIGADVVRLGRRAEAMLSELGAISSDPNRLVRLFLTPEHRRAADLVASWMRDAGMTVTEDALGTVRGHWRPELKKRFLTGSHIDTVIDAGKYDGPLGVVAGILAIEEIAARGLDLPFGIDVLAFGDEEGSRFRSTLSSSLACVGKFDRATLSDHDRNGVTLADAIVAYGKRIDEITAAAYDPANVAGFLEVHIEQGPVLEAENLPLGVVTGIIGQTRMRVVVLGAAGHAGTVPMRMRHDALTGASELMLAIERTALDNEADGMVATVGRIEASPGATNVIPGRVGFSLEFRSVNDAKRKAAIEQVKADAQRMALRRKLEVAFESFYETETTACTPVMQDMLENVITTFGHKPMRIPSGAGHDAQVMAGFCPTAMMFVRCRGGISHNPAEFASESDMGLAVIALTDFVEAYASTERS
ncbi:allantoate amidohydrolase [Pseudorhodoplanes sinuspersici]|uniref:Allantoate amidohydrolase n=1 Tax=Pseudorhodoplanes sinuspersici TaxID=1235591 RepID=A0A1W6ZWI0_9HYPH|nr:allantoate amidohydrolase [Pseudorhodoplanes sinuspersici]ARQ01732.1 allantoate amidohydrolase [Pseudorhodoplanes sinuspersici]RKE73472.1 allantoate deiminase [Pseudorhodoplanes sinuspersici]